MTPLLSLTIFTTCFMNFIINWNVNPVIFSIGPLSPRWYGLLFALSFLIGSAIGTWIFKRENKPAESLDRVLLYMLFGTIIGARLGECLFYNPAYYFSNPIEIFKVWKGGLASHGAALGLLISLYFYSRKTPGQSFIWILDRAVIVIALGCSFIRLGNLMNSEIIGKPTQSNWGFVFHHIDLLPRHPTQLYESFAYFAVFIILLLLYIKINPNKNPGILTGLCLVLMPVARFILEFLKENQVVFESGWILNMGQKLSIPMILLGIVILLKYKFFSVPDISTK